MQGIKLNKKDLIGIISGGIFLVLIIILYFYFIGEIRKKNLELTGLNNEINITKANLQIVRENNIDKKFNIEENPSLVISKITKIARSLLIDFKSITPKETKNIEDGYIILPVQMEIEGKYREIGRFFENLENLKDSIITIDNFNIKYDEKIQPEVSASLNLNIHLFRK